MDTRLAGKSAIVTGAASGIMAREVVVLNCCVTETNEASWASSTSTIFAKSASDRVRRSTHQVDPDEQAECPDERPWQAGDDDTREDQIDDSVYQNPLPFARQLTAMGDGEDDHQNTVDNEISDQHIGKDDQTTR